ncbi:MAG: phospholipase D-like domain-containing protein [Candidatus Thiodiazotropha sp. 6PLUC2]
MGIRVGQVAFFAGPQAQGAPDDLEKVVVDFINQAQKRLEIAVQELESEPIAKAIIAARQRKVLVKLVIEQSYLKRTPPKADPWNPGGKNELNREIHDAILRSNIDVKVDYNSNIFHQKFIVRDRKAVLTGSTNFTPTGTHKNLNHIVIVENPKVAKVYAREFKEIQEGRFGRRNEGHDPHPKELVVSDIPIKILFAPDHNPEMEIMKQMMKARQRIDFAIFTFAKSSGIDDTMLRLLEIGMPIKGVFDSKQGAQDWSPVKTLAKQGAKLFAAGNKDKLGKVHHKLMVLDNQVVIAGSFNYTGSANLLNDENIIILGSFDASTIKQQKAQRKIARYACDEIERMIKDCGRAI